MVGEGRQRHLERTQGDADGQHRADERAQPRRAQRPEEVARRLVAPCGPAFLARQDGEQGERAGHHRRPRDRERRTRHDERDEQRGEERPDDEDRLGQDRVQRERARDERRLPAEQPRYSARITDEAVEG